MIITIPIRVPDASIFPKQVEALCSHGTFHRHTLILNPAPSVSGLAKGVVDKLTAVCHDTRVVPMAIEPKGGPDELTNRHLQFMIRHLAETGNTQPWFWLGCGYSPIADEWADSLEAEYQGAYKAFMGREAFFGKERFVANPMILPANMQEIIPWWAYLGHEPFDFQWRAAIFNHARVTMQIGEPTNTGVKIAASGVTIPQAPTDLWLSKPAAPVIQPDAEIQLADMINSTHQKLRLGEVADRLNLPHEQVREIAPRVGLEVNSGGWVVQKK